MNKETSTWIIQQYDKAFNMGKEIGDKEGFKRGFLEGFRKGLLARVPDRKRNNPFRKSLRKGSKHDKETRTTTPLAEQLPCPLQTGSEEGELLPGVQAGSACPPASGTKSDGAE